MKTLKKVLCLVLALVMVVGTMAISAAAFTDDKDITNKDAVAVLNGIKVLEGYPEDGSFRPEGTLTRAEGATIITKLLQAEDLELTSKLSDVKGKWYEKYVAYCESVGVIAGFPDGSFRGEEKLTAVQFAKMVLTALGYDAEIEGLTTDFYNNTVKLATSVVGINVKAAAWNEPITRENAAQMAFQALSKGTVTYSGNTVIDLGGIGTITSGGNRNDKNPTLASKFGLTTTPVQGTDPDTGRPTKTYKYTEGDDIVVFATPVATHTGTPAEKTLKADVGVKENGTLSAAYFVDGIAKKARTDIKNGASVEVYGNKDGINVVAFNEYVYTLAATDLVKEDAKTETKAGIRVNTKKFDTTDSYAKDDVIVYTVGKDGKILTVAKAEKTENVAVTKSVDGTYTIGGKEYKVLDGVSTSALTVSKTQTVTIWTDANGLIVKAVVYSAAADPLTYAAVVKVAEDKTTSGLDANTKYLARLRNFEDGKTFDVTISEEAYKAYNGKTDPVVVTYKTNAKNSALTDLTAVASGKTFTDNLSAKIAVTSGVNANSKTVYLLGVKDTNGQEQYKVVTGYRNVPTLENVKGYVVSKDGIATYVYVSTSTNKAADPDTKNIILALSTASKEIEDINVNNGDAYKTYKAVVDAEIVTINVDADEAAGQFVSLKYNKDLGVYTNAGSYSEATGTTPGAKGTGDVQYANEVLTLGSNAYAVASSAKIYLENTTDKTLTAITVDDLATKITGANYTVYTSTTSGEAVLVVIVK